MYTHPALMAMLVEQRQGDLIREARRYRRVESVARTPFTGPLTRWLGNVKAALNPPKTAAGRPAPMPSGAAVACCD